MRERARTTVALLKLKVERGETTRREGEEEGEEEGMAVGSGRMPRNDESLDPEFPVPVEAGKLS